MTNIAIDTKSSIIFMTTQPVISLIIGFKTAFISDTEKVYHIWHACTCSDKCIPFPEQLVKILSVININGVPVDGVLYLNTFINSGRLFLPFMFYYSIPQSERNKTWL